MTRMRREIRQRIGPGVPTKSGLLPRIALCFLLMLFGAARARGVEIDRLVAAVNGKAITEGDLKTARSLHAVLSGGSVPQEGFRKEEIDRLVDQELLREELMNFGRAQGASGAGAAEGDETDVRRRLESLRDRYAGQGGISAVLERFGLQESDLLAHLRRQSAILAFVNFRFRPFAAVSDDDIKAYYQGRLAEQFRKSGLQLPPLAQIAGKVEEILREEKINAMLDQWIGDIRRSSRIEYFDDFKAGE